MYAIVFDLVSTNTKLTLSVDELNVFLSALSIYSVAKNKHIHFSHSFFLSFVDLQYVQVL